MKKNIFKCPQSFLLKTPWGAAPPADGSRGLLAAHFRLGKFSHSPLKGGREFARAGFSLIETAIVLVILGLLIGGVVAGRSLIRASELQSIISDIGSYKSAIEQFKEKYSALPGDMVDATSYWGTDPGGCPAASNTVGKRETCNGNGDGLIERSDEMFRAWQQLADANMIKGLYTGVTGPGSAVDSQIGVNGPRSTIDGAGYSLLRLNDVVAGDANWYPSDYKNVIMLGSEYSVLWTCGGGIPPVDAKNIDQKMDDGMPAFGSVMTLRASAFPGNCASSDTPSAATYNTAQSAEVCTLIFKTKF